MVEILAETKYQDLYRITDGVLLVVNKFKPIYYGKDKWISLFDSKVKSYNKEEYGLLCKLDDNRNVIEKYDICVVNDITRSGSYFSEYDYENEFRAEQIVKKVIPEVVIPEHTVITIGE